MPTLTIDGREVSVEKGTTILEAAKQIGIEIPHYCYHPGLRIAGSCRMCLVEIEGVPKLQISCYTQAADGMVVHTQTDKVKQARKAVLEFLLVDHPLDCPVCDQAGECYLQIYYMQHGRHPSRVMENKHKRAKMKVLGEHIVLDQERCILCSRCVRFTEEITKTYELGIFNRGDRSVVDLYPGIQLHNRYQGNLADICPVGALTDRQFRFQTRVWYLASAKSICPGCSRGCNILVDYNTRREYKAGGRRIARLRPRPNPEVNKFWMCDDGRYGYTWVDGLDRILRPRRLDGGEPAEISWREAVREAASWIREAADAGKLGVLLSPQMTNEELFAAQKLFSQLGIEGIGYWVEPAEPGYQDEILIRADKNPNTNGAALITSRKPTEGEQDHLSELVARIEKGSLDTVVLFLHDLEKAKNGEKAAEALKRVERVIYLGTNWNRTALEAELVLPVACFVEQEGSFTNFEGMVQRFWQAVPPLGEARTILTVITALAEILGLDPLPEHAEDAFAQLALENPAYAGLTYEALGDGGKRVSTSKAAEVSPSGS